MKSQVKLITGATALILAALVAGYWLGRSTPSHPAKELTSSTSNTSTAGAAGERKPLYYRNPMGLLDTSPVPKKDPMGMAYVPVFAGEEPAESASGIKISTEKIQKLGVRTEPASMRVLDRAVRAAGRVAPDERRSYTIAPKFEGFVERLQVNTTGQAVAKGQLLFEAYSPELVSAQREYAIAMQGVDSLKGGGEEVQRGMRQLADSSLMRLRNWDISEAQIKDLTNSQQSRRTLGFRSPVSGIVVEKKAVQGMRFMPGDMLYQITDLSSVWVIADVFEQDIGLVKLGSKAKLRISAYPDKVFDGVVSYVYPTLNEATRTVPVRIELRNPQMLLKPAMFAQVELSTGTQQAVLTVPNSAVIDSGTRALVLVQTGEGRFEPREVKLGARSEQYVTVLSGVQDKELVVVTANFLIDAESNLKAAVGGFGHSGHGAAAPGKSGEPASQPVTGVTGNLADGQIESIDASSGSVTINHGPIASLKWPAMTMEFKLANASLASGLKPKQKISFEIVERQKGEWVITRITPQQAAMNMAPEGGSAMAPSNPHAGH
jgi:RND family efflux transporter MFP subunit